MSKFKITESVNTLVRHSLKKKHNNLLKSKKKGLIIRTVDQTEKDGFSYPKSQTLAIQLTSWCLFNDLSSPSQNNIEEQRKQEKLIRVKIRVFTGKNKNKSIDDDDDRSSVKPLLDLERERAIYIYIYIYIEFGSFHMFVVNKQLSIVASKMRQRFDAFCLIFRRNREIASLKHN